MELFSIRIQRTFQLVSTPVYSRIIQVEIRERDGGVTCNGFAGIL